MAVYTVIVPLLIHVSSGATGWSEWSDCDVPCAWGKQFRSRVDESDDVVWENKACKLTDCTYSNGCSHSDVNGYFNDLIYDNNDAETTYRVSCADDKCHAFCVDPDTLRPNGKILYNTDKEMKDGKAAMNTKDWDGVITCVDDVAKCATRTYGVYDSSGTGNWCKPNTNTKYECWDLPCVGMKLFSTRATTLAITPADMTWRCAEGTCYPRCENYMYEKAVIKIDNKKYDMPSLNCHQNPFFLQAITSHHKGDNDYGVVSFHCEPDHRRPPVRNGQWHEWGECEGLCGDGMGKETRHRDCRGTLEGSVPHCTKGPGTMENREQRTGCTRSNCIHRTVCGNNLDDAQDDAPSMCNTDGDDPAGTKEKKKCHEQGTDQPEKREFVCTNPNECRWRCVDNPTDPWYDEYMWHNFPPDKNDIHIQHQAYYSGDMVCQKRSNNWVWKPYWGDNTGHDLWGDYTSPKAYVFGNCRTFWCFGDENQVTINKIMKDLYVGNQITWRCDRGVCFADCSVRGHVAFVKHAGRTYQQSHFSCTHRAILTDFNEIPNNQRNNDLVWCGPLPTEVRCPLITDQAGWDTVDAKYQIKEQSSTSIEFECRDPDYVIVDSDDGTTIYDATLPCADDEWDATVWAKIRDGTECKKAICLGARRKRREIESSVEVAPRSAWSDWGECDVSCGDGKQFRSKYVNGEYTYDSQDCQTGVTCSWTHGCSDSTHGYFTSIIENTDNFRVSCDPLKCQAFCTDANGRPNGKIFYKSNYKWGSKSSLAQKDWDGTMFCVDNANDYWDGCGQRSYGLYTGSGSNAWCRPTSVSTMFECYDMACAGYKNWISDAAAMSTHDMKWRCAQGTCYPQCPAGERAAINIGTNSHELKSLNCHQNPFFIHAIKNKADYGGVTFSCVADHTIPPKDGEWYIWGPCTGRCGTNNAERERRRDCREVPSCNGGPNKNSNIQTQQCTRSDCEHKCGSMTSATSNAPSFCNSGMEKKAGTDDIKKCSDQGGDDPSKRELRCTNPNECRWTCKDRPNDPWYDEFMWHEYPAGVHIQHQVTYSGDMVCVKSGSNSWSWKPMWGETEPVAAGTSDMTKPKANDFADCRTFWCFPDAAEVTIETIMNGLYDPSDLSWACDRGVCTATCNSKDKVPYVTHAGRTYEQAHYSCAHRGILTDFRDIPAGQRDSNNVNKHLITCNPLEGFGPPECQTLDNYPEWDALKLKFKFVSGTSTANSVTLECKDSTQTMSNINTDNALGDRDLTCADGVWDATRITHLTNNVECRDLSCQEHFTEAETYPCTDDVGDVTVDCDNDVCTASCPVGEAAEPAMVNCANYADYTHFECVPEGCADISTLSDYDTVSQDISFGPINDNQMPFECNAATKIVVKDDGTEMAETFINCVDGEWDAAKWTEIKASACHLCPGINTVNNYNTVSNKITFGPLTNGGNRMQFECNNQNHIVVKDDGTKMDETYVKCDTAVGGGTWNGDKWATIEATTCQTCPDISTMSSYDTVSQTISFGPLTNNDWRMQFSCPDADHIVINGDGSKIEETFLLCDSDTNTWDATKWDALKTAQCQPCPSLSLLDGYSTVAQTITFDAPTEEGTRINFGCTDTTDVLVKQNDNVMISQFIVCTNANEWKPSKWDDIKAAECRDLSYDEDFTEEEGYGEDTTDDKVSEIDCDNNECTITCDDGLFAIPSKITEANHDDYTEILCHTSPCGPVPYSDDDSQFTYNCQNDGHCQLTCAGIKVPNTKVWSCDLAADPPTWHNPLNHGPGQKLECIDDVDTPCGNVEDVTSLLDNDIDFTCDDWISIFEENILRTCTLTCSDGDDNLVSVFNDVLTCENQSWVNGDPANKKNVQCCPSPCCSHEAATGFATIDAYMDITLVDDNTIQLSCPVDGEVPVDENGDSLPETITCDATAASDNYPWVGMGWQGATWTSYLDGDCAPATCDPLHVVYADDEYDTVAALVDFQPIDANNRVTFSCKDTTQQLTVVKVPESTSFEMVNQDIRCNIGGIWGPDYKWGQLKDSECRDLHCHPTFTEASGFGTLETGVNIACNGGTCTVTCDDVDKTPFPSTIDCTILSNGASEPDIFCHESPCGPIPFATDEMNAQMTYDCDVPVNNEQTCTLKCHGGVEGTVPNTKEWVCNTETKQWINTYNHPGHGSLKCIEDQDTPCGDVSEYAEVDEDSATYTCDSWISILSLDEHRCAFGCADNTHTLQNGLGGDQVCDNKAWETTETVDIFCCESPCCSHEDAAGFGDIDAYTEVTEIDVNTIELDCMTDGYIAMDSNGIPLPKQLTCDPGTGTLTDRTTGWTGDDWNGYVGGSCVLNECSPVADLNDYDTVMTKLDKTSELEVNGDTVVEFACKDIDQIVTDVATDSPIVNGPIITCSGTPKSWDTSKWSKIVGAECRDLSCDKDFTEANGYGPALPAGMTLTCKDDECTADCGDKYPFPLVIDCTNINDFNSHLCHESPCGPNPYTDNDSQFTYNCDDQNICQLACAGDKVPNTKVWQCDPNTKTWLNPYNHHLTDRTLECIDDQDTPCGNVVAHSDNITGAKFTCATWVSIFDTTEHACAFTCDDNTQHLINEYNGDLTCENGVWESAGASVNCCASKCCEIENTNNYDQLASYLDFTQIDENNVEIECIDSDKVPLGGDDSTTTTTLTCNELQSIVTYPEQGWETAPFNQYRQDNGGKCVYLPCDPSTAANDFVQGQLDNLPVGIAIQCSGGACVVTCTSGGFPNYATIDCSNWNEIATEGLKCQELPCTDVDDVYDDWGLDAIELTIDCTNADATQECTITCTDTNQPAVPSVLWCDGDKYQPQQKPTCQTETECGYPNDWDYGTRWSEVDALCDDAGETCTLLCSNNKFPYPVSIVSCKSKVLFPCPFGVDANDPNAGIDISCEVSPCGDIEQFGFDETEMSYVCDESGCTFTCLDATLVPNTVSIICNTNTKEWINEFSMNENTKPLECVPPVVTPCGNFADVNIELEANGLLAEVDVTCEEFTSIFDISQKVCSISCGQYHINGPEEYTCENGNFDITNSKTQCCERICCGLDSLANYAEIETKYDETWNEADHYGSFECKDPSQVITNVVTNEPVYDTRIGCDIYTQQWDTETFNILVNAECRDLSCSSTLDVSTLTRHNGAVVSCNDDTCTVTCTLPTHQFPIPSTIDCDNAQSVIDQGSVACESTPCGDPTKMMQSHEINVDCDTNTGVCDLSCPFGTFIYPVDEVMCVNGQILPSPDSLDIWCAQTACGDVLEFGFDWNTMTADCDEDGCSFDCKDNNKVPNTKQIVCHALGLQFVNSFDMDANTKPLECIDNQDTPCGNVDTVATVNSGVTVACDNWISIFDVSLNEHHCKFDCQDQNQVIYGHTTVITCTEGAFDQTGLNMHCWNPDTDDTLCGSINDIYPNVDESVEWSCNEFECTPQCTSGLASSVVTITCDPVTGNYDIDLSLELTCDDQHPDECGLVSDAFDIDGDVIVTCVYTDLPHSDQSKCTFLCSNDEQPTMADNILCINGKWQPESFNKKIECANTKCGEPEVWNFGIEFNTIDASCNYADGRSTCTLDCTLPSGEIGFVIDSDHNEVSQITCESDRSVLPVEGSLELVCAETLCGKLNDEVTIDIEVIVDCTSDGCVFTCPAGKIATHKKLDCVNGVYNHYAQSETQVIKCVDEIETPCGDTIDMFNYDAADVAITCAPFDSIYQTNSVVCQASCVVPDHHFEGDTTLTCVDGEFTNINRDIWCAPTPCGDPADYLAIEQDVQYECDDNGECTFWCDGFGEISLISNLICDAITKEFKKQILWADTSLPFEVNTIICVGPDKPTFCGDPYLHFTNVDTTTAEFDLPCDFDANVCAINCKSGLGATYLPTLSQVNCNPHSQTYIEPVATEIACVERDTVCGDIDMIYTVTDSDVRWTCTDTGNGDTDCVFSCNTVNFVPSVTTATCDHATLEYELDGGISVAAIECKPPPDTNCGYLSEHFTIANDVIITCNVAGRCDFSCTDDSKYISMTTVFCHTGATHYSPPGGLIKCYDGYDTACGNLVDEGFVIESNKVCNNNVCTFNCPDVDKPILKGLERAECVIGVDGTRSFNYFYSVPSLVDELPYSRCVETMCGDVGDTIMDTLSIHESVDMTWNIDPDTGYGSLALECTVNVDLVISGLGGDDSVVCMPTTGVWDIDSVTGEIKCSHTVCGDPTDVLTVSDDATWTCVNDVCTFDCGVDNSVNLEQLLCDQSTGQWVMGDTVEVMCSNECTRFGGSNSDFKLDNDVLIFCGEYEKSSLSNRCDMFCPGNKWKPFVNETGETLTSVICRPAPHAPTNGWLKLEFDDWGIPRQTPIEGTGIRTILCDEEHTEKPGPGPCDNVFDVYQIEKKVNVACSHDTCVFTCDDGFDLNTNHDQVYCLNKDQLVFQRGKASTDIAGLHNGWQPIIPHAINCIEQDNDDHDGDKDGEGDGECGDGSNIKCHMCDPINEVVTIDDDVLWDCSDDHCQFACIDDDVNVDLGMS